jgi:hypothetical protein
MLKHRGGALTPRPLLARRCPAATPLGPSGFARAPLGGLAAVHLESASRRTARLGGTGPSALLELLDVAHDHALTSFHSAVSEARHGAPPLSWPRGAHNAVRSITRKGS